MAEDRYRRLLHFDLLDAGLDYFDLDSAATYHYIRVWMKKHQVSHDQLSGYVTDHAMSNREVLDLFQSFIRENPQIAACMEGFRVTRYERGLELSPQITEYLEEEYPQYAAVSRQARQIRELRNRGKKITHDDVKDFIRHGATRRENKAGKKSSRKRKPFNR